MKPPPSRGFAAIHLPLNRAPRLGEDLYPNNRPNSALSASTFRRTLAL